MDVVYTATGQAREEILWRTWIADFYQTYPAPRSLGTSFRHFIRYTVASKMADTFLGSDRVQIEAIQAILATLDTLQESCGRLNILPTRNEIVDSVIDILSARKLHQNSDIEKANEESQLHSKIIG